MIKMEKFKILAEFIKDISSETKNIETYLFVKEYISEYQLTIDINSEPSKNRLIEVNTILKFTDKKERKKKSHFEIIYTSFVKIDDDVTNKDELQKIILCDVQKKIQPNIEKAFKNLLSDSGFKGINVKKIDFDELYKRAINLKN